MDDRSASSPAESLVRFRSIRRFPTIVPIVIGVVLITGITVLDRATGPDVSVVLLHAFAVMSVTWLGSRRTGLIVGGLAVGVGIVAVHLPGASLGPHLIWNGAAQFGSLAVVAVLVAALRDALIEQRNRATVDRLTGSMSRAAFELVAERERLRSGRNGSAITLAYFDLDDFKSVNDQLGHSAGDRLLRVFAASVRAGIRSTDVLSRMGGDEFVLLLPETDAKDAVVVVDRVRRILADLCAGEEVSITTSVGIATYRFPPSSIEAMVAGADELMYRAKARGGDTIVGTVIVGPWTRWSDHIEEVDRALNWG